MSQWIVAVLRRPGYLRRLDYLRRPEFWLVCLLGWLLLSAGRSLGTPWERLALTEALRWGAGIGLALALGVWRRGMKTAAQFSVTLLGTLAALGLLDGLHSEHGGLVGPYHDHQLYASALLALLPPSAALALTARDAAWRWGALASGTAGAFCLLLTQTRSAWAGLLTAAIVFGWLWLRRTQKSVSPAQPFPAGQSLRHWRAAVLSTALLLTGVAAVWMLADATELRASVSARAATLAHLGSEESWQERLTAWHGADTLIASHPWTGIGLGRYPAAQWAWTHLVRPLDTHTRPSLSEEAHSFYLQTAAETGIFGLGLYLAALTAFAVQALRRLNAARNYRPGSRDALLAAALSGLAGQAVDACASPSWQFAETSLFFWAVLGLGLAALQPPLPETATDRVSFSLRRFSRPALAGIAAIAITAQFLPLGLLTPVEAYDNGNAKLTSLVVTQVTANCPATYSCFTMTAYYPGGSGVNVTFDSGQGVPGGYAASFSCFRTYPSTQLCSGTFGTGTSRNQIKLSNDIAKRPKITGQFSDRNGNHNASLTLTN